MSNKAKTVDCIVMQGKFRERDGTIRAKGEKVKLTESQAIKYKDCIIPETQLKAAGGAKVDVAAIRAAAKAEAKEELKAEAKEASESKDKPQGNK